MAVPNGIDYPRLALTEPDIQRYLSEFPSLEEIIVKDSLPHRFVPASDAFFREQYYFDSYIIFQGLEQLGKEGHGIMLGMAENFFYLMDKYGHIPNSPRWNSRSQPPFLSSMVLRVYGVFLENGYWNSDQANQWLRRAYSYVKREYEEVWAGPSSPRFDRETGMSRYFDHQNGLLYGSKTPHFGPTQESGMDNSMKYEGVAHRIFPIELSSLLFMYENNLEAMASILGYEHDREIWAARKEARRKSVLELMWNGKGFSDYDPTAGNQLNTDTLAGYFALWARLLDPVNDRNKIQIMVKELERFEHDFGLAATTEDMGGKFHQWGFPNGWAPLHLVVIEGLKGYGFQGDADRIAYKWLRGCAHCSRHPSYGQFPEKISVADEGMVDDPRYRHQKNAYWTWGSNLALLKDFQRRASPQ